MKFCEVSRNPKSNWCFSFLNQQMAPWWRNFGGKILPFTLLLTLLKGCVSINNNFPLEKHNFLCESKTLIKIHNDLILWILKANKILILSLISMKNSEPTKARFIKLSLDFLIVGILYLLSLEFWRNFHNWNKKVTTTKLTRCVHLKKSDKCIF